MSHVEGRRTATRTLEIAAQSGGEADYQKATLSAPERNEVSQWRLTARASVSGAESAAQRACADARRGLAFYVSRYLSWRTKMGAGKPARELRALRGGRATCPRIRYLVVHWRERARVARRQFEKWFERTLRKWACIHEHEGAWTDPNAPHYGGLQFDDDFQRTYGPEFFRRWGDAGNWPVWAQLVAAERAYRARGFDPWPNTARACGLL